MATEYTVALRNLVSGPAGQALRDVDALRAALGALEAQKVSVGARSARAQAGSEARSEAQKRNAAFRRLLQAQREEEQFTRYRIRLMRREVAERERAERQQLAAQLRRIRAAQRAEAQAERERTARAGRLGRGGGSLVSGALGVGLKIGGAAAGVLAAGAAFAGGQAIETAQLVENARMRLTAQLGSVEAANREIKDSFRIAEKTIFDPRQVVDALSKLSTNFKEADARRYVFGAISDFATVSGKGQEGLERSITAISQIMAKGKLQQEELTGQLGELGLPARRVYAELASVLKVQGKDDQARTEKVLKLITAGKVDSTSAVQAITKVMRDLSGGGPAGSFAVKSADTLSGLLSNIKGGFASLFGAADSEKWPAFVAFKDLLRDIAKFFSVDSTAGAAFMTSVRDALTRYALPAIESLRRSFNAFTGDPERVDRFVRGLVTIGQRLFQAASAAAYLVEKFVSLWSWAREVDEAMGFTDGWSERLYAQALEAGKSVARGLAAGLMWPGSKVLEASTSLADTVIGAAKSRLGIQSPSRVMMQLGAYSGEGFARGLEGGAGRVAAASRALGGAATEGVGGAVAVAARGGALGAGAPSITIEINLPIQTAQDGGQLARDAGPLLGAEIERVLDRYFGRLAAQGVG